MTGPPLVLDGSAIHDIAGFYAEINRVFMTNEDWQLAPSLDALDDLLYGGYGALAGHASATVRWTHIAHSRAALGVAATRAWLQEKQARPGVFSAARIATQLDALERGAGQTYFDLIMDVFAAHPTLHLRTD
ncbi:barstar family protein [Stenotrophomonas rhizophila]|uniref:Ribonuclease inhibitor n=1 Tax=Stenotrophomonas rhizophila TaxID=216778 RepID=A0A7V7YDS3_9GAMM|nr:barstar family protein [Stenotrophomonas rhizophila]KAB7628931.1 ribonuclease inhibitor [Stenotrophomonas rhizophila]